MTGMKWQNLAKRGVIFALVLCCALAAAAHAEPAENRLYIPKASEEYEEGIALELDQKYEKARRVYEFGTSKNCPWCMYRLGMFCIEGRAGLAGKNDHGIRLLKRASRMNHLDANYWLGVFYLEGQHGLKKNQEKGVALISKAAELGQLDAISRLGFFYLHGLHGVEKDREKALELLKAAIDRGVDTVALVLGTCYEDGWDLEQNFRNALACYEAAKALGNEDAEERIYNLEHLRSLVFGCHCPGTGADEYYDAEINSDADFKGKPASLSGIVLSVEKDDDGCGIVTLLGPKNTYRNVKCTFEEHAEDVDELKKEDIIRVEGVFEGVKNGFVIARHCKVVPILGL